MNKENLSLEISIQKKISSIHEQIINNLPETSRIAVALYDEDRDLLKTFINSTVGEPPVTNYQYKLNDSYSLTQIKKSRKPRIVNDLDVYKNLNKEHSKKIAEKKYGSSFTYPIFDDINKFYGFLFINSEKKDFFTENNLQILDPYVQLLSIHIIKEVEISKVLTAILHSMLEITHHRDPETGAHLKRMSAYCHIIAMSTAEKYKLSDEFIEHLYLFSPMHDIGKVAIADKILLKEGPLTKEEFELMKAHTIKGREIIEGIIKNFPIFDGNNLKMILNIIEFHHETLDGKGYPKGLSDKKIPIESKITAVADIFDALTSERPYKKAWSIDEAFAELQKLKGIKLEPAFVDALVKNRDEVEEIKNKFVDR
ncbi:MAG: HD domain-containing protein [Spirochaetia bacterium]|nr:HD domain-containing protein [Spirochaetia bacterium]